MGAADMDKIRILIADDHAILRAGLRRLIEGQDDMCVVAEAETATGAVAQADTDKPDVVLLDITMPGGSGIKSIGPIRSASPKTRVLVLTMHDDQAYLRSAMAAGAAGYMVKTGADTELLDAIRTVAGGRSYVDVSLEDPSGETPSGTAERPTTSAADLDLLSKREREVLELVAHGYTHREIAEKLTVSVKSVETYRARLVDKLGLKSRADLVRYALDAGVLGGDESMFSR